MSSTVEILGVHVSRLGAHDALTVCEQRAGRDGGYVCFVNAHTLASSMEQPDLKAALDGAAYCFADGRPVVWVSHLLGEPVASQVSGPDFTEAMLMRAASRRHGFIGGAPGCADAIVDRFHLDAVTYSPPVRAYAAHHALEDWEHFLERCPDGQPPPMVWVGLGAPKQELWLNTVAAHAPAVMFYGVGAAFDFLAGKKARAPRWMSKSGLEWVHRLGSEPGRLWKRYAIWNTKFVVASARQVGRSRH